MKDTTRFLSNRLAAIGGCLALLFLLVLAGCGGSGSSSSGGGTAAAKMGVFFTDNLSAGYDHVWVTAYKVELYNGSTSVTVLDNPAGDAIDLRALGTPAGGQFLFLGPGAVPPGTYTKVEIILGRTVSIFPTGATTATSATFPPSMNSGTNSKLELPLTPPLTVTGSGQNLIVDFDLANWTLAGGIVTPALRRHDGSGLDDLNRHEEDDYKGTISGLSGTAPTQTFILNRLGSQVQVVCSASTKIYQHDGAAAPSLANGQIVEVRGVFDVLSQSLKASSVKVEDGEDDGEGSPKVEGATSALNAEAGTLKIAATKVRGFVPTQATVNVATSPTTRFLNNAGASITKAAFFTALAAPGSKAEAEGLYDSASNTIAAKKLKLEDEHGANEAETRGIVSLKNAGDGFVVIDAAGSETEGFTLPTDGVVKLQSTSATTFKSAAGATITKAQFFELVTVGATVKGNGTYSAGILTCRKMEIRD